MDAMDATKLATIAGAARMLGVSETTLRSACSAGHVTTAELACGQRVVVVASARQWAKTHTPGRRGRRPAKK